MYRNLKTRQLILLTDCLLESHRFARMFNKKLEQSNPLIKSGTYELYEYIGGSLVQKERLKVRIFRAIDFAA